MVVSEALDKLELATSAADYFVIRQFVKVNMVAGRTRYVSIYMP
jgi:hypothetical protein